MESARTDRKSIFGGLVLASIVAVIFIATNLPFRYIELNPHWLGMVEFSGILGSVDHTNPTIAGWPLRYWIYVDADDVRQQRYWSGVRLLVNTLLGICITGVVFWLAIFRARRIKRSANSRRTKAVLDIALAAFIVTIPASAIAYLRWVTVHHEKLITEITLSGNCLVSAWVPEPLVDTLPSGLYGWLQRIRRVQCIDAESGLARRVCELPTLVHLELFGGTMDGPSLSGLKGNPFLYALGMTRQTLSSEKLDLVTQLSWLAELDLSRTDLDSQGLARLDSIKRLRTLNLSQTNLAPSDIGTPGWASELIRLTLSRPAKGTSGTLKIEGWPRLETLLLHRNTLAANDEVFEVRLADLPSLTQLRLDRLQKHRLHMRNVPLLEQISDETTPDQFMMEQNIWIPGLGWYVQLHLEDMPSLTKVQCFAQDLESFSFKNVTNLKSLEIGSYLVSLYGDTLTDFVEKDRCQDWIDQVGESDGPHEVVFAGLPLDEVDLTSLAKNRGIRRLQFIESPLRIEQVRELAPMNEIVEFGLGSCEIRGDDLSWFLRTFPRLEAIRINGENLEEVNVSCEQTLTRVEVSTLRKVDSFRMAGQPDLGASFRIEHPMKSFEIRDARSLRGLAIAEPWPSNSIVTGLRDLRWFAAGGKHVNDSIVNELLECPYLDQLTLAYPAISKSLLYRIGEFSRLSVLVIPGAEIDDDVTSRWTSMRSLWEINLDDSRVGVDTIAWLSELPSLRSVSLNRVPLDQPAAEALAELRQLSALRLREVNIRADDVASLLAGESLELLDVSYCPADPSELKQIIALAAASPTLKGLIMHGCKVDAATVQNAFKVNPNIAIDYGDRKFQPGGVNEPHESKNGDSKGDGAIAESGGESSDPGPDWFDESLRDEVGRRLRDFRSSLRLSTSDIIRNQAADPAASEFALAAESNGRNRNDAPESMRPQGRRRSRVGGRLDPFATTADSGRLDLEKFRALTGFETESSRSNRARRALRE
ncbi:hypothetical protein Poly51_46760 [Rubripirellula tenax]|uniref:Leucine Rich repeats (2 copies) n=1 Tax=Rubripirellula tenax TaxID=2528015 RepID=A0A5C6EG53_9BACT|nr:hypothetical protein [Rubripirellula tenax]TWU48773.1 hypothetical protein Poly51_46760 [Rubripirellula tenax]